MAKRPVVRGRPAVRRPRRGAPAGVGTHSTRIVVSRVVLVLALVIAGARLVQVQGVEAATWSEKAEQQRTTVINVQALRGAITDRNNTQLAFSAETRQLTINPDWLREDWKKSPKDYQALDLGKDYDEYTQRMAAYIRQLLGSGVNETDLLNRIRASGKYQVLVRNADPSKSAQIVKRYRSITQEARQQRIYPDGTVASNLIGFANWRDDQKPPGVHGLVGLENAWDDQLKGTDGSRVVDTASGNDGLELPGTTRDIETAVPGSGLQLTIDADVQYQAQQMLDNYKNVSGAQDGSMVVMDKATGEIYALAVTNSFDPNNTENVPLSAMGNPAVSNPFEPGSVNKIVTAAGAVEYGIAQPDTVVDVKSQFKMADRTVTDAWSHGDVQMTLAGIIGKSSNIGTLEMAQKIGPDRFVDLLTKFGLGQKTGVGLPGESAGVVPPRSQWSGSTFANLPIGQGLTMTLLQMTGMYQAIANDGLRVPPRIVKAERRPDGSVVTPPKPDPVRVVSPQTAKTVRDMMRAVMQKDPEDINQNGTGYPGALAGYQVSGKTGTAQQIDPNSGAYSNSLYWITFAGVLPADNPRLVVGIMLDKPKYTSGPAESRSAAPLFHQMASYLVQHFSIPMSATDAPIQKLQLP
ncbi:penicillin-binding protein 2 [Kutzneria viridogrisea]|uniref:Cell division protein FtsI (Penicillin-binding protein 3) n=1 Tax=Kutzneria viridogrisea TaxID=47990 RepID=A0ABR6BFK9_9PSEU|nr:cell division protein FtsI (penicillin-binding protein 3) [Kutzneria viridogrisea]